jgi:hypothetical protein
VLNGATQRARTTGKRKPKREPRPQAAVLKSKPKQRTRKESRP